MKIAWATDIHLNFIDDNQLEIFNKVLSQYDAVFLTGDLSEFPYLKYHLEKMAEEINKPIYFVLGNHDYYYGSVKEMKKEMKSFKNKNLFYLANKDFIKLNKNTAIVGHDCWYDGKFGDYWNSRLAMSDFLLIEEFYKKINIWQLNNGYFRECPKEKDKVIVTKGKTEILEKMEELSSKGNEHIISSLKKAYNKGFRKIIALTHVPPFLQNSLYNNKPSNDTWAPFFTNKNLGDNLLEFASNYKDCEVIVLCGHSHHRAIYQPLNNLIVKTGDAEYNYPKIEEILEY